MDAEKISESCHASRNAKHDTGSRGFGDQIPKESTLPRSVNVVNAHYRVSSKIDPDVGSPPRCNLFTTGTDVVLDTMYLFMSKVCTTAIGLISQLYTPS